MIVNGYKIEPLAYLKGANLEGAYLKGANLMGAYLEGAYLMGANLEGANLEGAYLEGANLGGANLMGAYLEGAYLEGAYLGGAYLMGANLEGAYLKGANLGGANLGGAYLMGANLEGAYLGGAAGISPSVAAKLQVLPDEGDVIGWKKCRDGVIVKLLIEHGTPRSSATTRKCRAKYVRVLEVYGAEYGVSQHDGETKYAKGAIVHCDNWCDDRWKECAGGIHFFITRQEAEDY